MNRRALLIALVTAGLGVTVLLLYMQRFEHEMSGGEQIELLTLVKKVERGATITEDMLSTRFVPLAYVEDRAVKVVEKPKVLGLRTSTLLGAQQTLMWTDLAVVTEQRDLSSLVQPGKRGVTVRASGAESTEGNLLIRPGDYVDVVLTTNEERSQAHGKVSVVLLEKILVLAVGLDTQGGASTAGSRASDHGGEKLLTFSLNLQEAQLLALAVEKGRISVGIRNPDDPQRMAEALPDMKDTALLDSKAREEAQAFRAQAGAAKRGQPIKIEGPAR